MKFEARYLLAIIPIAIVGGILYYLSDIVAYVIIAWVLSMIGAPLVRAMSKYIKSSVAAGLTLALFGIVLTLLVSLFVPTLVQQARNLGNIDYNAVVTGLQEPIKDWNEWLIKRGFLEAAPVRVEPVPKSDELTSLVRTEVLQLDSLLHNPDDSLQQTNVTVLINVLPNNPETDKVEEHEINLSDDYFSRLQKGLFKYLNPSRIPAIFGSVVGFFSNFLIAIMSIFFIAFFFLKEHQLFDSTLVSVVPDKYVEKTMNAVNNSSRLLMRYFIGILTQISIITVFVTLLLSVLGVRNALLIGFFAALMNVIPYLGPLFGAAFAVLITVSSNLELPFYDGMVPLLLKVIAVFAVMQLIDNFVLQPNIFSKSVKAHPLEIFLIVLVGAKIGGVLGMVLAIPVYTVFRVIAKEFLSNFKIIKSLTKNLNEA